MTCVTGHYGDLFHWTMLVLLIFVTCVLLHVSLLEEYYVSNGLGQWRSLVMTCCNMSLWGFVLLDKACLANLCDLHVAPC